MPGQPFEPIAAPAALLCESPLWHPLEQALYWCDIPGRALHRFDPTSGAHRSWPLASEPGCCVALQGGGLLLAQRDGLWRFDAASGQRELLHAPPYDPARQRFNDGKADAQGRLWVGTLDDQREARAGLYCLDHGRLELRANGLAVSNGVAFSPDGGRLYWADTRGHLVYTFDVAALTGALANQRIWQRFAPRELDQPLSHYGGRPDGATVDSEDAYWVAMFEGRRLLRLAPGGELLSDLALPVQCPTMPCFGGPDLRTLYITTVGWPRAAATG